MPAGYFISYAENGTANCQTTGSTQIFLTDASASFSNPSAANDVFWSSPDVGDNWANQPNLIIAFAGDEVANPLPVPPYSEGATAKVTFWGVAYSDLEVGYLELMNTVCVQLGLPEEEDISGALTRLKTGGAWTNYDTNIPAFQFSI
jgi:hypothetical protein